MRKGITLAAISALLVVTVSVPAMAWNADFFEGAASANATYEEMVISPQAIYDDVARCTYLAYQGPGLDPYIMAYDHKDDSWDGPYRIGDNPLVTDMHGGPAMVIDQDGYIVIFYGGRFSSIRYARSARPRDVSEWIDSGAVLVGPGEEQIGATYPQPVVEASGAIRLYYRREKGPTADGSDLSTYPDTWRDLESVVSEGWSGGSYAWSEPELILHSAYPKGAEKEKIGGVTKDVYYDWYADVDDDGTGAPALAAVRRDLLESSTDYYIRKGVYYIQRSGDAWTNAHGDEVAPERTYESLQTTAAVVSEAPPGAYTNQVVLRREADGTPCVLYLVGSHDEGEEYEWRFARWNEGTADWDRVTITTTDDFFDAGTFEVMEDGNIEAFLTTGGTPDDQWSDDPATREDEGRYATRGGDITQWRSDDHGQTWTKIRDVIKSPGAHARYNNPQIVRGEYDAGARLLFSEWNNDASSFIHKVYLWGAGGFKQRSFTPDITRLAGLNRIETAIEVSQQAFPNFAATAVLATSTNFPDALCGVPLAQALRAPVLLSKKDTLDPMLAAELKRLGVSKVVILGSSAAISTAVESSIKNMGVKVERIQGSNRYETSVAIADRVADLRGAPASVIVASGENFPDALSVSPYAARRGYPILLTPKAGINSRVKDTIAGFAPENIIVIGSAAAVSDEAATVYAAAAYASVVRWGGANRYETGRIVAEHALAKGPAPAGNHSMERFVLATGTNFPDALCGGLLAARANGVLLLTPSPPSAILHADTKSVIDEYAFSPGSGVLDAWVLGGPTSIAPNVMNELAAQLSYLDAQASN